MEIIPLTLILTCLIKDLYPVIFSVSNVNKAIVIRHYVVDKVELPWTGSRFPPGQNELSIRVILMNVGIPISVRDKNVSVSRKGSVGAPMEGFS
jgi:hypothetical protein